MSKKINLFANLKSDFASGLVVFLVALPLCLGIALASGAPPLSGIIAGIIGGVVVGFLSNSHISVSGPAAGLTAIVLTAVIQLGTFNLFLTAGIIAGIIQLVLGFLKAGSISNYFPNNVIEGMLAGIGIFIVISQIPHAVGYSNVSNSSDIFVFSGDFTASVSNSFKQIIALFGKIHLGALLITIISLAILIVWEKVDFFKKIKLLPGALIAVIISILINELFILSGSSLAISENFLVKLPIPDSFSDIKSIIVTPDFNGFFNSQVWIVGATIAVVASIETLLCIEASDRMDHQKRTTNTNLELKAQGIGNMLSSLIGGLPMTSVVVRSSANNNAGAKSKMSAIIHGFLLLISVISIPFLLNKIPLATLAAVLLLVGYKLAKPSVVMHFYQQGKYQFVPFIVTLLAVVFTDLLKGVALGIFISILFILRGNLQRAYRFRKEKFEQGDVIRIDLAQEVSFLNKAAIKTTLAQIPSNSRVVINASDTVYIAHDVLDLINDFVKYRAVEEGIQVKLKGFKKAYALDDIQHEVNYVFFESYEQARLRKLLKKEFGNFQNVMHENKI